jgi:hypothetical protein
LLASGIAQGFNAVKVSVADVRVEHELKLGEFTKWLERTSGAPRDIIQRQKVREILGMPVTRWFGGLVAIDDKLEKSDVAAEIKEEAEQGWGRHIIISEAAQGLLLLLLNCTIGGSEATVRKLAPNAEPLWIITNATRRFRPAGRHFITCARRLSAAPFHELVKSLEICARFTVSKELRRLQRWKLFSHSCGDELVYARPIFFTLSLHCPL